MNKKTIRLAGWALGLSMAVAGIGAAAVNGVRIPVETKASVTLDDGFSAATMTAGTNGSSCTVNGDDGIKVGTSKQGGNMTVTVPSGATVLRVYAAAWNGVNGLSLNITSSTSATVSSSSIALTADTGISNNSPFTLAGSKSNFRFDLTLSGVTSETVFTFASSIAKRFVLWDAQYQIPAEPSLSIDADSATIYTSGENMDVDAVLSWANFDADPTITVSTSDATVIPTSKVEILTDNENDEALATITQNGKAGNARITFTATYSDQVDTAYIDVEVIDNSITLSKIEVTTLPTKTTYNEDEALDLSGIVVTATFSNDDTTDVTSSCTFSPTDGSVLSPSDDTVTVSYSYNGGVPKETSFEITVNPYVPFTYSKVTTAPADWRGTYMLVYENGEVAFDGSLNSLDASGNSKAVDIVSSSFTGSKSLDSAFFTIGRSENGYYLKSASGYYIGRTTTSNGMNISESDQYVVTPAISDGVFSLTSSGGPVLRFNKSSGQERFRFYASGQEAVAIYKRNVDVTAEANAFGSAFLSATSVCDPTGAADNISSSIWNAQKTAFLALSADAQGLIASTTELSKEDYESGNNYEKAVTRYNYIVNKYGKATHADFMNRIEAGKLLASAFVSGNVASYNVSSEASMPLIITVISTGVIASTGLFFLSRRHKED